jgi:hypothetical protein
MSNILCTEHWICSLSYSLHATRFLQEVAVIRQDICMPWSKFSFDRVHGIVNVENRERESRLLLCPPKAHLSPIEKGFHFLWISSFLHDLPRARPTPQHTQLLCTTKLAESVGIAFIYPHTARLCRGSVQQWLMEQWALILRRAEQKCNKFEFSRSYALWKERGRDV